MHPLHFLEEEIREEYYQLHLILVRYNHYHPQKHH